MGTIGPGPEDRSGTRGAEDGFERQSPEPAANTLEKGLKALEVLCASDRPLRLTEIAEHIDCGPSTTLRILRVLVRSEYVLRDPVSKLYLPAPRALLPLSLYHPLNGFRRDAHAVISGLREKTGLTIALVLFLATQRLVVDIVHGSERLSPYYETHLKRPVHSSATGKILLMSLPAGQWIDVLGAEPFPRLASRTRVTRRELLEDIELAKSRGFSSTCDESVNGLSAVAAPISNSAATIIGSIGAFGHTTGLAGPQEIDKLGQAVRVAADLLSQTSNGIQELSRLFGNRSQARQLAQAR